MNTQAEVVPIPYCWLSTPLLAKDDLMGTSAGLPLRNLFRHGVVEFMGKPGTYPFVNAGIAQCIREGNMRLYLAAVDAGGEPISFFDALYVPTILLVDVLVMSAQLFEAFQANCDLTNCEVIRLRKDRVFAHEWTYELPEDSESDSLFQQLFHALEYDELPGDYDIVRMLCERFPCKRRIPEMVLILPPYVGPPSKAKAYWRKDAIEITIERESSICTTKGNLPVSKEYFDTGPIVKCQGFLVPPAAARLLKVDDPRLKKWAVITYLKEITLRLPTARST